MDFSPLVVYFYSYSAASDFRDFRKVNYMFAENLLTRGEMLMYSC